MRFRAIASDLDGTLLRSDGTVSPRTRAALDAADEAGLLFVIATGRPPRWMPPVLAQLGDHGLVVCANGASVYDPVAHELVHRVDLQPEVLGGLVDDLEAAFPEALLGVEQGFEFGVDERVRTLALRRALEADVRIAPIRSFLDEPVTKLIVRFPTDAPPGRSEAVQAVVGDRALVTRSMSEVFLELSHPDVHKAAAVERLLVEHGAPPESVVAFGDMPNDVELIRWAGLGVAVANAHPELLAAADEVTASNDDDGVALVIERILAEA